MESDMKAILAGLVLGSMSLKKSVSRM